MASYSGTVESPHAPAEVFAYLAAFEHTAEWDPNCKRAERVGGGALAVGTKFKLFFKLLGPIELPLNYEIVEFDDPVRVRLSCGSPVLHSVDTITVEPGGTGGSRVTYDAQIELPGPGRFLDPILGAGFQRAGRQAEAGLSERLRQPI